MTGILLAISFIIHILTLLSVIIVWKKSGAADQRDIIAMKKEMEDILLAYTSELKEENEAFLKELQSINNEAAEHNQDREQDLEHYNDRNIQIEKQPVNGTNEEPFESSAEENTYIPPIDESEETFGPSTASLVLSMQSQGYSIDDIAKKVKKGKGEVELMLKLYRDEQ